MRSPSQAKALPKKMKFGMRKVSIHGDPGPLSCADPSSGLSSDSSVACEPAAATSRAMTLAQLQRDVNGSGSKRTSVHAVLGSLESFARVNRNPDGVSSMRESDDGGGTGMDGDSGGCPSRVVSEGLGATALPEPQCSTGGLEQQQQGSKGLEASSDLLASQVSGDEMRMRLHMLLRRESVCKWDADDDPLPGAHSAPR
jgi:hypothetical protein